MIKCSNLDETIKIRVLITKFIIKNLGFTLHNYTNKVFLFHYRFWKNKLLVGIFSHYLVWL